MEHFRSPAPSMLIICYTLLKSLFCSVTLRTYLKIGLFGSAHPTAVVWTLVTTSYMLILCAELVEKRRLLRHKVRNSCRWKPHVDTRQTDPGSCVDLELRLSLTVFLATFLVVDRLKEGPHHRRLWHDSRRAISAEYACSSAGCAIDRRVRSDTCREL